MSTSLASLYAISENFGLAIAESLVDFEDTTEECFGISRDPEIVYDDVISGFDSSLSFD